MWCIFSAIVATNSEKENGEFRRAINSRLGFVQVVLILRKACQLEIENGDLNLEEREGNLSPAKK